MMDTYLYHFLFPFVALVIAIFCLLIYVYDLRDQVKVQEFMLRRQRLLVSRQRAVLEVKNTKKLTKDECLFVDLCTYMDEKQPYLNADLRVEDLASVMKTNRTTLGECVRKYTDGLTVLQFLNRNRLTYAAHLLGQPDLLLTVAQVASASGFKSRSAFHRQFVHAYGCSPSEFRSRILSQTEGETPSNCENTLEK